jgi:hypothetical protein
VRRHPSDHLCQFVLIVFCTLLSRPVAAQEVVSPGTLCWHARPIEHCRAMILTNFGGYLVSGPASGPGAVADWGVLVNVSARAALGASLFASQTRYGFLLGPAVRYRRWLGPNQSIDFALGTPLFSSDGDAALAPYGLVKYNPVHWAGLAVRPEWRRGSYNGQTYSFVISAGVELGWVPGFAMTLASGAVAVALLSSQANSN